MKDRPIGVIMRWLVALAVVCALMPWLVDGFAKSINWDHVMKTGAQNYAETFTEDELKESLAFYKSPTGQRSQEKQPELTVKTTSAIEKMMVQLTNPVQAIECDRSCAVTVGKAYFALERLKNEAADLNLAFNEDTVSALAKAKGLAHIAGPYYGWAGCNKQCGVLVRLSKLDGRWVIEGAALNGVQPEPGAHYVYRMYVTGGTDLPATVIRNIVDANDGDPIEWNSYPLGDFATGLCYTESVISTEELRTGQPVFREPKGMACGKITGE